MSTDTDILLRIARAVEHLAGMGNPDEDQADGPESKPIPTTELTPGFWQTAEPDENGSTFFWVSPRSAVFSLNHTPEAGWAYSWCPGSLAQHDTRRPGQTWLPDHDRAPELNADAADLVTEQAEQAAEQSTAPAPASEPGFRGTLLRWEQAVGDATVWYLLGVHAESVAKELLATTTANRWVAWSPRHHPSGPQGGILGRELATKHYLDHGWKWAWSYAADRRSHATTILSGRPGDMYHMTDGRNLMFYAHIVLDEKSVLLFTDGTWISFEDAKTAVNLVTHATL